MHDYSRDIMLATSQEMIEMRMALSAAETKANALNQQVMQGNCDTTCVHDEHPIAGRDIQCRAPVSLSRYTSPFNNIIK